MIADLRQIDSDATANSYKEAESATKAPVVLITHGYDLEYARPENDREPKFFCFRLDSGMFVEWELLAHKENILSAGEVSSVSAGIGTTFSYRFLDSATSLPLSPKDLVFVEFPSATSFDDNIHSEIVWNSNTSQPTIDVPASLQEAMAVISNIKEVALDDGCVEPSDIAVSNAKFVLEAMFNVSQQSYDIYPMDDGEIAIDIGNHGNRIGVFCYPDGKMQYVVSLNHEQLDIRKDGVWDIPIAELRCAFSQLDP